MFGFDVCATVYSQVYGGYSVEETTNKAVDKHEVRNYTIMVSFSCFQHGGGRTDHPEMYGQMIFHICKV